jgi:hypothetical protein
MYPPPLSKPVRRCSTTVDKRQAEATTADDEQQADAPIIATDNTNLLLLDK